MNSVIETLKGMGDDAPKLYVITTGAGAGIQKRIQDVPGISNFFVGARMPYDMEETVEILGFKPDKFVSDETAIDLAMTAYMKAWRPGRRAIGLGLTASIASLKEHRGDHRIVVAAFTNNACYVINLVIPKGVGEKQRIKDGNLSDELAIYLLTAVVGGELPHNFQCLCELLMCEPLPDIRIVPAMALAKARIMAHPYFQANGRRGTPDDIDSSVTTFYPGAFNPLHDGHIKGSQAAMRVVEHQAYMTATEAARFQPRKLVFTTTVNPPHKDELSVAETLQRVVIMKGHNFLLTEGDPLYIDKAKRFQNSYFIMGADALDRMMDPKWGSEVTYVLSQFQRYNTKLLILGRLVDGVYMTLANMRKKHSKDIQATGAGFIFVDVPFRLDLSSSELRAK